MKLFYIIIFSILSPFLFSQEELGINSWDAHLPFNKVNYVTQSENKIFFATDFGIVKWDPELQSEEFLTRIQGLNDIGISSVHYIPDDGGILLVIYKNSNIDLITNDRVINMNNIFSNSQIAGDKFIYQVDFLNPGKAYLSCGFGIVELDYIKKEFGFTTFTGLKINDMAGHNGFLYAATDDGLYRIENSPSKNFADFGQWNLFEDNLVLSTSSINSIGQYSRGLLIGVGNTLYSYNDSDNLNKIVTHLGYKVQFIESNLTDNLVGFKCDNHCQSILLSVTQAFEIEEYGGCHIDILHAIKDENDRIWFADEINGFRMASNTGSCESISFNTPYSEKINEILVENGNVHIASGGVDPTFTYLFRRDGLISYVDKKWEVLNVFNNQFIEEKFLLDFYRIVKHPTNEKLFVGTYWGGLLEIGDDLKLYNRFNSSLQGTTGDTLRERISGLAFDKEENLWMTNFSTPRPVSVMKSDGTWKSFSVPALSTITEVKVDHQGNKWMVVSGNNGGVLVFDSGSTIEDVTDDRFRFFNSVNSELKTNKINTIEIDLDGSVWVGTEQGPVIFRCGDVFEDACVGFRKLLVQNGVVAELLETENIKTIGIDGGNRKWIGTDNGLFVQSPEGDDQIFQFNSKNSKLLDDKIVDIAIDHENGNVYIGTQKGLNVFRSDATLGGTHHKSTALVYPNPVPPGYNKEIAIKGLARDSDVKITDVNGRLVFQTKAIGGQAIWDGKNLSGRKVGSGVYLAFGTTSNSFENPNGIIAKILFIN